MGGPPEALKPEVFGQGKGYLDSAWNTMVSNLDAFASMVGTMSRSDFSARALGRGDALPDGGRRPAAVYLRWPLKYLAGKGGVLLELILDAPATTCLADAGEQSAAERRGRIQTLLLLDELPAYPLKTLPDDLVTMRSAKLSAMLFVQSLAQLEKAYGANAQTVMSNCD